MKPSFNSSNGITFKHLNNSDMKWKEISKEEIPNHEVIQIATFHYSQEDIQVFLVPVDESPSSIPPSDQGGVHGLLGEEIKPFESITTAGELPEQKPTVDKEAMAEKIRFKYMPNGAINLKGKGLGDGKPQFRYEKQQMIKMLIEFGEEYSSSQNEELKEEVFSLKARLNSLAHLNNALNQELKQLKSKL